MAEKSQLEKDLDHLKETIKNLSAPPVDITALLTSLLSPIPVIAETVLYTTTFFTMDLLGGDRGKKTAHLMVYGCPETVKDPVTGKERDTMLEDIDLNDTTFYKNRMPEGSKLWDDIETMIQQFFDACSYLAVQAGALVQQLAGMVEEVGMSAADVANKLATMPPQPASAAYAIFDLNNKILNLSLAFAPLMAVLAPLKFAKFLFPVAAIATVESTLDTIVVSIDTTLQAISKLKVP